MENSVNKNKADDNDAGLEKGKQPTIQNKPDDKGVPTVTPDNDSGTPGPSIEKSLDSNRMNNL